MPAEIQKLGEGFYAISRIHAAGHRTPGGQILAGPDCIQFPFRRPGDPAGYNLDPADVITVLREHLLGSNPAAAAKLQEAAELLGAPAAAAATPAVDPLVGPDFPAAAVRRSGRPRRQGPPQEGGRTAVYGGGDDDEGGDE